MYKIKSFETQIFSPSNSNMKRTVNKSAAGKYSMFFIYSSQNWWGGMQRKVKNAQEKNQCFQYCYLRHL